MGSLNRPTVGILPGKPHPSRITIYTADKKYQLTAILGPEPPEMTEGRAGWEEVARDRKPSITQWTGSNARKLSLTIMLDKFVDVGSVEDSLAILDKMAPVNPSKESPTIYVKGIVSIPQTVPWKLNTLSFSERIRRVKDGATIRVMATLELLQYSPGTVIVARSSPAKRSLDRNKGKAKVTKYTVRKGDTLGSIAAKLLGSASKWKSIATLNGLRSATGLKVGKVLKIPAS